MVFSIEFSATPDAITITSLDRSGMDEDIIVDLFDDGVVNISQWSEDEQDYHVIQMCYDQLRELILALDLPEGMYLLNGKT